MNDIKMGSPQIIMGDGSYFDYDGEDVADISIENVAYGLGNLCRFVGQTFSKRLNKRIFYSVAQHCVLGSYKVRSDLAYDFLMHELGEVTCGDMTGPMKLVVPEFKYYEKKCSARIERHFGVMRVGHPEIKKVDLRMLATEKREVTASPDTDFWGCLQGELPYDDMRIDPWSPEKAGEMFLKRYKELRKV